MAFTYGFYNSLNGDRRYKAEQFGDLVGSLISEGVFENVGSKLFVTVGTGMDINVGTGKAWFNNTWNVNDSVMVLEVPRSDITRPRYDTVVLEVNTEIDVRENKIKIVSGTPGVNPTRPVLINTERVHQHPLAHILVPAAAMEITASNIEIVVGRTECPFCTAILQTTDITDMYNQWKADFNAWFNNLKTQLTDNVVTNLQMQIDGLGDDIKERWNNTLSEATRTLLGLPATATPDDAFKKLKELLNTTNNTLVTYGRVGTGSYTGNGSSSRIISLAYNPVALLLFSGSTSLINGYYGQGRYFYGGPILQGQTTTPMSLSGRNLTVKYTSGIDMSSGDHIVTNNNGSSYAYIYFY